MCYSADKILMKSQIKLYEQTMEDAMVTMNYQLIFLFATFVSLRRVQIKTDRPLNWVLFQHHK